MSKRRQHPRLPLMRDLLRDLAAAFDKGTMEGIHAYAETSDVFERLTLKECNCCGQPDHRNDLMSELAITLYRTVNAVADEKKRRAMLDRRRPTA